MAADHEPVVVLAQVAFRIKVAHVATAAADPSIYEFSIQRKHIVCSLTTAVERALRAESPFK
jgi:hypothetical protein